MLKKYPANNKFLHQLRTFQKQFSTTNRKIEKLSVEIAYMDKLAKRKNGIKTTLSLEKFIAGSLGIHWLVMKVKKQSGWMQVPCLSADGLFKCYSLLLEKPLYLGTTLIFFCYQTLTLDWTRYGLLRRFH